MIFKLLVLKFLSQILFDVFPTHSLHIEFMATSIMLLKRSLNVISHHKFDIIYIQNIVKCDFLN